MSERRPQAVLSLNSGSSTLKFGLHLVGDTGVETLLLDTVDSDADLQTVTTRLEKAGLPLPEAVGHRVVHGGPMLRRHCLIDDAVLAQLKAAKSFAPLHIPPALQLIQAARQQFSGLPQIACFDTVFHQTLPPLAYTLPVSRLLRDSGIRRYGFHGLSCESIMRQLGAVPPQRVVIAHLGSGASVTAVQGGQSVDTSMGLTPSGGVMMGTRSGDIDPGLLIHLLRERHLDADELERLFDHQAGLLGVSGIDSDIRALHEANTDDAKLAIDLFCRAVSKQIAAMATVLGGIDLLVFTGGIGEHDEPVRAAVCSTLSWMGVAAIAAATASTQNVAGRIAVRVLPSQEDQQIARHVGTICSAATDGTAPGLAQPLSSS